MNTVHWHLTINHLSMVGVLFGTCILIWGILSKASPTIKRVALGVLIFSAAMSVPAYLTGEGAEEAVEKLPGVSDSFIEKHEDLGKVFLVIVSAIGVLSLLTLVADRRKIRVTPVLYACVLLVSLVATMLAYRIGTTGGEIRHTEIRNEAQLPPAEAVQQDPGESEKEEHN